MTVRHSFPHGPALLLCLALTACGSAPSTNQTVEADPEITALQQQLAGLIQKLQETRDILDVALVSGKGISSSPPSLAGTVTKVADGELSIHVDHAPEAIDLRSLLSQDYFHIGVYGPEGFKADAIATQYDTATATLRCMTLVPTTTIPGDRAMTAAYRAASTQAMATNREAQVAALQQQLTDIAREEEAAWIALTTLSQFCFRALHPTPDLAGVVTEIADRHCTIRIDDNPFGIDIAAQIARRPFRVAVCDANGYKAEVVSQRYDATTASLFCNVMFVTDGAKLAAGDRASTK